jgi:hypothetical protein
MNTFAKKLFMSALIGGLMTGSIALAEEPAEKPHKEHKAKAAEGEKAEAKPKAEGKAKKEKAEKPEKAEGEKK